MATTNDTAPITEPITCPLARDANGNPVELPAGTVAWRVRRHTGGRPRILLGVDKQPMQLPLAYTIVDLEDILAPGAYRLDSVDHKGDPLGLTVAISVGQLRNADDADDADEPDEGAALVTLPASGSETRLVLEANVRATQMAFQHNQKTLELGLKMAEALRDGVRVMADAQADWIKSMASARGFFRNAPPLPLPPAPEPKPESDEDDDDDDVPEREPDWVDKLTPLISAVVPQLVQAVMSRPKASADATAPKTTKLELGDIFDWRRAAAKHRAATEAPVPTSTSDLPPMDLAAAAHFMQIQQALTEQEATLARAVAAQLSPTELRAWFAELKELSVADAAAKIRGFIAGPTSKPAA